MKAIVQDRYGPPGVLELRDIDEPIVADHDVLVRVRAASANPADWHFMRGLPYIMRPQSGLRSPKRTVLGRDIAGEVEAVGRNVTRFRPGDEVLAHVESSGFAEYACV
jgi:NADPH:quinone reductase-like Zn-dependent oxidoreductase